VPLLQDHGIKVAVPGASPQVPEYVWPMPPQAVDDILAEAAAAGPALRLVAQMPLAEDAGLVAGRLQHLGDVVAFRLIRSRSMIVCVTPDLNSCRPVMIETAGGRAGRADMVVASRTLSSYIRSSSAF